MYLLFKRELIVLFLKKMEVPTVIADCVLDSRIKVLLSFLSRGGERKIISMIILD